MTFDIAVWKHDGGRLADAAAGDVFERLADESDARYPERRTPVPELVRLADLLEQDYLPASRFDEQPWEELRDELDGDFLYLSVGGADAGGDVLDYVEKVAPGLGLLVYSPISESVVAQP